MAPRSLVSSLKTTLSLTTTLYIATLLLLSRSHRSTLLSLFSPTHHPLRLAALLISIGLNAKSLPLIWHLRFSASMIRQLYTQPTPLPKDALFRPLVTTGQYTSLPETDYNMHKSNSTYFADLDIARTQLVSCLMRKGIREANRTRLRRQVTPSTSSASKVEASAKKENNNNNEATNGIDEATIAATPGAYMIALGGVSCNFKREIPPYAPYEIWSRVLSWDAKWIYLVSHIVQAGAVKPDGWALQPWRRRRRSLRTRLRAKAM